MAPYPPYAPPPPPAHARRYENKAVASLALGVASVLCLGVFAGAPAIVLGALARRDIDRSGGSLAGGGLAAGGIVAGLFGTGVSVLIAVSLLAGVVDASRPPSPSADATLGVPVAVGTRSYGSLDVVDLDDATPLPDQLRAAARAARAKGHTVILQTYVRSSRECAELALALPDPRMQRALADVTLVRVDVDAFEGDLRAMRVETDTVPWFYKLDPRGRPVDAISADEWDENLPENMAPVLSDFARGTLRARRAPAPVGTSL